MLRWSKVTTEEELQLAKAIRRAVFIEEQGIAEELEHDQYDILSPLCTHILVFDGEQAAGTARLRIVESQVGKLERICTLRSARGKGVGAHAVAALESIARASGLTKVKLGAQLQVQAFYEKLGYVAVSDIFMDAGIQHVLMEKKLD